MTCGTERFDSRLIPPCVRILNITVSQLRLNPLTGRWVTIVAERAQRPSDFAPRAAEIEAELAAEDRVVFATDDVVCIAPFWSGAPFELLLMPRRHEGHLQDADPASLDAMGRGIRDAVKHLSTAFGDLSYNLGFHTAPHEHSGLFHWHVHLWPNLVTAAGFERGTGVMINVMPPERAAETLRAVRAPA